MDEDLKEGLKVFLVALIIMSFIAVIAVGITLISDKYEIKAFNRIHGTDYTFGEWFWAQDTIKDYHLGTVENKNYQVDLNVNDDRVEGGE